MGLDDSDPVLGGAFTGTHTGLGRLRGNGLVGEDLDPDLTAALGVARHGDTGGLDLIGGDPAGLLRGETELTVVDDVAAGGFALHAAALYSAVFHSLRH